MKKLFAFDMDDTLAESKQPITEKMDEVLTKLSRIKKSMLYQKQKRAVRKTTCVYVAM